MPRAKRKKPYNPTTAHDRRSHDLLRNAEVAAVEVDNPLALEPGQGLDEPGLVGDRGDFTEFSLDGSQAEAGQSAAQAPPDAGQPAAHGPDRP